MKGKFTIINSEQSLTLALQQLKEEWLHHRWLMMQTTNQKQRSQLQNNSLHLYCEHLAQAMNNQGFDVRFVLNQVSQRQEVPWTGGAVKEHLWRPTQIAYMGEHSTTKASTKDYPAIYDSLHKHLVELLRVNVAWPCKETMGRAA